MWAGAERKGPGGEGELPLHSAFWLVTYNNADARYGKIAMQGERKGSLLIPGSSSARLTSAQLTANGRTPPSWPSSSATQIGPRGKAAPMGSNAVSMVALLNATRHCHTPSRGCTYKGHGGIACVWSLTRRLLLLRALVMDGLRLARLQRRQAHYLALLPQLRHVCGRPSREA